MSGQEEIPVDQKASAVRDSGHGRSFVSKNGSFHSLRLSYTFAETPRLNQNTHVCGNGLRNNGFCSEWWIYHDQTWHCSNEQYIKIKTRDGFAFRERKEGRDGREMSKDYTVRAGFFFL